MRGRFRRRKCGYIIVFNTSNCQYKCMKIRGDRPLCNGGCDSCLRVGGESVRSERMDNVFPLLDVVLSSSREIHVRTFFRIRNKVACSNNKGGSRCPVGDSL